MPVKRFSGSCESDTGLDTVIVRNLGRRDYRPVWHAMSTFTDQRGPATRDEIWLVEHTPVFTLGRAGKRAHLLDPGAVPVIQVDRGGQVTYHGPGQVVIYLLIELRRHGFGVRHLVDVIEQGIMRLLADYAICAHTRPGAPGVYVDGKKIAALGLRIRRGASYHGLSLNVNMDLEPFGRINPCGYAGLEVTQVSDLGGPNNPAQVAQALLAILTETLGYARITVADDLPSG